MPAISFMIPKFPLPFWFTRACNSVNELSAVDRDAALLAAGFVRRHQSSLKVRELYQDSVAFI